MPGEFVFLAELTEEQRQAICPVLSTMLSDFETQKAALDSELEALRRKLYQGLTPEEFDKLNRKIRRGDSLTADEQRFTVLNKESAVLNRNVHSVKTELIQGDRFCRE